MVKKVTIDVPEGCRQIEIAFDDLQLHRAAGPAHDGEPARKPPAKVPRLPDGPYVGGGMDHPFGWDGDDYPPDECE
jgi:hypothetical protein